MDAQVEALSDGIGAGVIEVVGQTAQMGLKHAGHLYQRFEFGAYSGVIRFTKRLQQYKRRAIQKGSSNTNVVSPLFVGYFYAFAFDKYSFMSASCHFRHYEPSL